MSNLVDLSSASSFTVSQTNYVSKNTASSLSAITAATAVLQPSSSTRPQSMDVDPNNETSLFVPRYTSRKQLGRLQLTSEEELIATQVSDRIAQSLTSDHIGALFPDVDAPFQSAEDAVDKLLPYHIFQHPREDLGKGKSKATEKDLLRQEIAETKFALECFKRKKALHDRLRRARTGSSQRNVPDDQGYLLAQAVLDADRKETSSLISQLRNARAELDKIEREKRLANLAARPTYATHQPTTSTPVYGHHYRAYQYPYAPPYAVAPQMPMASTSTYALSTANYPTPVAPSPAYTLAHSPPTPAPAAPLPQITGAIPVQLPVSSLPTLHALGIIPVPANSLSQVPAGQPPPAILRGSSANGTQLNLEINVSLLQAAQMSGLALVLNSIMRGSTTPTASPASSISTTPTVPPTATPVAAPYLIPPQSARGDRAPPGTNNGTPPDKGTSPRV